MTELRIAAAQYEVSALENWDHYIEKAHGWVSAAVQEGAQLLVFPEYFSMELASLFNAGVQRDLAAQLEALQSLYEPFQALYAELAQKHKVHIQAGSFPVAVPENVYHNRAWFFAPDGTRDFQDKIQMTRFENEQWKITGARDIKVIDTAFGKIGINVCYDCEFPLIARRQVEAGAVMLLVPSCTDHAAGYWRVRIGAQARALENQCIVVQSSLVGEAPWSAAIDVNVGAAGIYAPPDLGFPDNGVIATSDLNIPKWVYANVDMTAVARVRNEGQVFNFRDWPTQIK